MNYETSQSFQAIKAVDAGMMDIGKCKVISYEAPELPHKGLFLVCMMRGQGFLGNCGSRRNVKLPMGPTSRSR